MRYLALGDSYTIGTGASDAAHAWPSIVAARLGAEVTNPAVNGYTTLDLIREELPLFGELRPEVVTVLIGVNDLVQGRTIDQYRGSLAQIYDAVNAAKVVAISIPAWSFVPAALEFGGPERVERLTRAFNDAARREASGRGFAWVDIEAVSRSGIGTKGWIASDDLHPGDAQYAAWAEVIWPAISELTGIGKPS